MVQAVDVIGASLFSCNVVDDSIQCTDPQGQNGLKIAMEDVICVLPLPGREENQYKMLFLRDNSWAAMSQLGKGETSPSLASIHLSSPPPILLSHYLCAELPLHLRPAVNQRLDIHIIISNLSGTGKAGSFFSNILQPLLSYVGLAGYEVHETQSSQSILELCQSRLIACAKSGVSQTIILLSGDGGLTDIVNSFHNTPDATLVPPNIALIPMGTGNAMASSLGLLSCPTASLAALLRGTPKPIPAFAAKFSPGAEYVKEEGRSRISANNISMDDSAGHLTYGAVVASWGIHAALVADSDTAEYRKFGAERFQMVAKELLYPSSGAETHSYDGKITLSRLNRETNIVNVGTMECRKHMYVLATFVPRLEKDFIISPESVPLDGCLRMVHFGPVPPERAMQLMSFAYQGGRHVHESGVLYSEIEGFRIDFREADEKWRRICIDGRIFIVEESGWVEVQKETKCLVNILINQ